MKQRLTGALGVAVLVAIVWFTRPWWHGLFYSLYASPGSLYWAAIGLIVLAIGILVAARRGTEDGAKSAAVVASVVLIFGVLLVGPVAGGIYSAEHMADEQADRIVMVDDLPETDADNPRILPETVARTYGQNSLQYPRHRMAGGDITFINGTPHWSYSLAPDGLVNSWRINQQGGVYVDMTTQQKNVRVIEEDFKYGQGQIVFDDYSWQLKKEAYWRDYQDPFVVPHDGTSYLAVPYVTHDWHWRWSPLPQPYAVPQFGGVMIISPDGEIEDLSPDEALESPILEGQNIYPYDLARYQVDVMQYQHGAMNVWFYHEDQLEIADLPGDGNDQPFTVPTEDGIDYFVATEPYGDATGVYQIWVFDARTGDMELKQYDASSSLTGPAKAVNYVGQHPDVGRLNNAHPVEPIPVVIDGKLYWQVRVIPDSSSGLTYTAFVDAHTNDVVLVETTDQVKAFLGGTVVEPPGGGGGDDGETIFVIVIEHGDGTVERINVTSGDSVRIDA